MLKKVFLFLSLFFVLAAGAQTVEEAVAKNDTALLKKLLLKKPDLNKVDKNGVSPLMTACRWGYFDIVALLLEAGAKPDSPKSPKGRTALMVACAYYSDKDVCRYLIKYGADVNAKADDGTTALMLAAQNAKVDVVELLLKNKADVNAKDKQGQTALDYAESANPEVLKEASGGQNMNLSKEEVISLLEKALLPPK